MQAEIEREFQVKAKLIGGGGGIFKVEVDGKTIFDKFQEGRFPTEEEIVDKLRSL